MAASPRWKIYTKHNEYIASCKFLEDAAALIALYGKGSQIRDGHRRIVYQEGQENGISAAESYDEVRDHVWRKVQGE